GGAEGVREAGEERGVVWGGELEEGALVDYRLHDAAHLVRLADVARDGLDEPRLAARGRIRALTARSDLVDRRGHVGEEASSPREGFLLRVHRVVPRASLQLYLPAAAPLL